MKAFVFYIFILTLFVVSCKPEELPPSETGNPVFYLSNNDVNITAGEDDFYLFTDYSIDDQQVYSFAGRFAKTSDCETSCKEELLIEIRDAEQSSGSGVVIENALTIGNYSYKSINPVASEDSIILNLRAEPEGNGPFIYEWTVTYQDTSMITELFDTEDVTLTFANDFNFSFLDVCLNVKNNVNCEMEYCNSIYLDPNSSKCQADFNIESNSPVLLELKANMINGVPPFTYLWSTGANTDTFVVTHNGSLDQTFCVAITDSAGCIDTICKNIFISGGGTTPIICASGYSYDKEIIPGNSDSLQLSTVLIQYTDSDGVVYRSDLGQQSNSSSFKINVVEDYEPNENGDKTKKIEISGNCLLFDEFLMPNFFPFEGIIAVAYP